MKTFFSIAALGTIAQLSFAATGVKGTFWSTQSDAGGCQMPEASYAITDAVALGQGTALGDLKFRPGMCGQVLDITCGNAAPFPAVVVSTCNINSDSCGIDMIQKTWNKATNNASPGIATCKVTMSTRNPLSSGAPQCFHRTGSSTDAYSRILSVLNTAGKVPKTATLAGMKGTPEQSQWFEFNANGQALFKNDAKVVFTYESGETAEFALSECVKPTSVQIFS